MTLRRRTPLKPSAGTQIPSSVRIAVNARDPICVGRLLSMPGECMGGLELDHIEPGGMGMKSPSIVSGLVRLCAGHHRYRTEHGREWRPQLRAYVAGKAAS